LVVVLPGIGGSELRMGGDLLWGLRPGVLLRPLRLVERLADPDGLLGDPEFDDGVRATRLVGVPVPGLTRLLGYEGLRRRLLATFSLDAELNYLEFPYDWRRPIAQNAVRLAGAVATRLQLVRERLNPRAEVILVGHSMGGLVAREYLEHQGGHRAVRKLLTLGSPFRGSVKALDFLVNGPKLGVRLRALAEPLGQIPSIYELLPMYPVIVDRRQPESPLRRVVELTEALPMLDSRRVSASREFLLALNRSELPNRTESLAGFGPPTLQQAVLDATGLRASRSADLLPGAYNSAGGDGTVPVISARPLSSTENRLPVRYDNQSHGGLVTATATLDGLMHALRDALSDHDPVLGPGDAARHQDPGGLPAIQADVGDFYQAGEPVRIPGRVENWPAGRELWAQVGAERKRLPVAEDGSFELDLGLLDGGLHQLDLLPGRDGPAIVSDVVEVG
jgi:pimeloyl-ACP methyl ester carboxylesterase